ncbi:hypothetical protein SAMN06265377_1341 [Flagellimonas pacifica]|uniref:Uncharacterized protein n=1 Tax=Flagellimonas pacifica TaxID=1247520 RepID=A0A285MVM7_9FLAO|nr:hypothetical protein SAMN06265377_1341 [Allomuricauda parva]
MGTDARILEQLVAGEQYLAHHVAVLPEMPSHRFHPQVIKAVKLAIAVILDDTMANMVEGEGDVPAGYHLVGLEVGRQVAEQFHQAGLPTAHRTGEQDALVRVDAQFSAGAEIPYGIVAELEQDLFVLIIDLEIPPKEQPALGPQINEDLLEIIVHTVSAQFPEGIDHATFGYLRGVVHSPFPFVLSDGHCHWQLFFSFFHGPVPLL